MGALGRADGEVDVASDDMVRKTAAVGSQGCTEVWRLSEPTVFKAGWLPLTHLEAVPEVPLAFCGHGVKSI